MQNALGRNLAVKTNLQALGLVRKRMQASEIPRFWRSATGVESDHQAPVPDREREWPRFRVTAPFAILASLCAQSHAAALLDGSMSRPPKQSSSSSCAYPQG